MYLKFFLYIKKLAGKPITNGVGANNNCKNINISNKEKLSNTKQYFFYKNYLFGTTHTCW